MHHLLSFSPSSGQVLIICWSRDHICYSCVFEHLGSVKMFASQIPNDRQLSQLMAVAFLKHLGREKDRLRISKSPSSTKMCWCPQTSTYTLHLPMRCSRQDVLKNNSFFSQGSLISPVTLGLTSSDLGFLPCKRGICLISKISSSHDLSQSDHKRSQQRKP